MARSTEHITVHAHEMRYPGLGADTWRPAGKLDHDYRGMGTTPPGKSGVRWSPCDVCGKKYSKHRDRPWRSCSYCGSIHPQDLLGLDPGTVNRAEWADWKYGYPHKMYVEAGPGRHIKFYSRHLVDFPELVEAFNARFGSGVEFELELPSEPTAQPRLKWRRV